MTRSPLSYVHTVNGSVRGNDTQLPWVRPTSVAALTSGKAGPVVPACAMELRATAPGGEGGSQPPGCMAGLTKSAGEAEGGQGGS
jgi:hypothetical protein